MDTEQAVRTRILALCQERSIPVSTLAEVKGVDSKDLNKILDGRGGDTTFETVEMICDAFGISLADFFVSDVFTA